MMSLVRLLWSVRGSGKNILVGSRARDMHRKWSSVEMLTEAPGEAWISPRECVQSGEGSHVPWGGRECPEGCEPETGRFSWRGRKDFGKSLGRMQCRKAMGGLQIQAACIPLMAPQLLLVIMTTWKGFRRAQDRAGPLKLLGEIGDSFRSPPSSLCGGFTWPWPQCWRNRPTQDLSELCYHCEFTYLCVVPSFLTQPVLAPHYGQCPVFQML